MVPLVRSKQVAVAALLALAAILLFSILGGKSVIPNAHAAYVIKKAEIGRLALFETKIRCQEGQFVRVEFAKVQYYDCVKTPPRHPRVACVTGVPYRSNVGFCAGSYSLDALHDKPGIADLVCDGGMYYIKTASGIRKQKKGGWRCREDLV